VEKGGAPFANPYVGGETRGEVSVNRGEMEKKQGKCLINESRGGETTEQGLPSVALSGGGRRGIPPAGRRKRVNLDVFHPRGRKSIGEEGFLTEEL